jgi:hypothetical protein
MATPFALGNMVPPVYLEQVSKADQFKEIAGSPRLLRTLLSTSKRIRFGNYISCSCSVGKQCSPKGR